MLCPGHCLLGAPSTAYGGVWCPVLPSSGSDEITQNIYLVALGLSCGMWALVPWPGIEPGPPALGVWDLSHWTTREVPQLSSFQWPTSQIIVALAALKSDLCLFSSVSSTVMFCFDSSSLKHDWEINQWMNKRISIPVLYLFMVGRLDWYYLLYHS